MRTRTPKPDPEIEQRKRLRPLFEFLHTQANDHYYWLKERDANSDHEQEGYCATELGTFMRDHEYTFADLMALRERPRHWDRFHAEKWEWFLRRLMNQHSDKIIAGYKP